MFNSAKKRNRKKKNQTTNSVSDDHESGSREEIVIPNTCNVSIKELQLAMDTLNLQQKPAKTQEEALQKSYQFWSTQPVPKMGKVIKFAYFYFNSLRGNYLFQIIYYLAIKHFNKNL